MRKNFQSLRTVYSEKEKQAQRNTALGKGD